MALVVAAPFGAEPGTDQKGSQGAFENTSAKRRTRHSHESDLALTPAEIEAGGQFELIGPASIKVIRDCAPTDVAEEAHWTPNPLRFETTAVAEREESGTIPHHGVGNNYGAAGWVREKSDTVCCVDEWHEALQSALIVGGYQ